MNLRKILALLLIAAGIAALVYGGFEYTKDTRGFKLGPLELDVQRQERVEIPVWAGVGAIAGGALMLAFGGGRRR